MRLTFFGSSLVSSYWNGAATYYRGLLRALAELGHEITFCEPDAYQRQQNRDLATDPSYSRVIVYSTESERDDLVEEAFRASDWVIKCSGVGVWDAELEELVAAGGSGHGADVHSRAGGGAATAFLDVDAPATLSRLASDASDPFRSCIPRYDHILSYGGGPPVVDQYRRLGARACTPIYNALDPLEHFPIEVGSPLKFDLLFMGNRLPDREHRVEEFFIRAAELVPGARFGLGGEGWADRSMPSNVVRLGHVPTVMHNALNASARLILNIHRDSMVRNGWSPATRMFEAAGAAACQITDEWEGIEAFFEPGEEIFVATDGADVASFVKSVDVDRAGVVGRAALQRALREHTYSRRAVILDSILRDRGEKTP